MALKPDQKLIVDDINLKCASISEKGFVVVFSSTAGYAEVVTSPSGKKVAGVLLLDVVANGVAEHTNSALAQDTGSMSITTAPANRYKLEQHVSGVVRLGKIGELRTNAVKQGITFAQGNKLYITGSGKISNVQDNSGCECIGHALSAKDSDGYIRIFINIA